VSGYVHAAGQGAGYDWRGAHAVIKASGDDALGQLAVMESIYPVGLSVPRHFQVVSSRVMYVRPLMGVASTCRAATA